MSKRTVLLFLCFSSLALVLAKADPLAGTRWKIVLVPDKAAAEKGEKEVGDTISFVDGTFSSAAFVAKGFKPVAYRGDFEEKEAEFEVTQENDAGDVLIWLGDWRDGKLAGSLQWRKKGGTSLSFHFAGVPMERD